MNPKYIPLILLITAITFNFQSCQDDYDRALSEWKENRFAELKSPFGWTSVVGLYWMRNSTAYFGRKDNNDFILPSTAPTAFGKLVRSDSALYMMAYNSLRVHVNGESAPSKVQMLTDKDEGGPTVASWKSLQWYFIKREDKVYLRVKDSLSTYRENLKDIPYFPVGKQWIIQAKFTSAGSNDRVQYSNILDMQLDDPIAGHLDFEIDGRPYRLIALDNDDQSYFVIFSDQTTGKTTYGGGRYIYPQKADESGFTILDFNKAVNPPCVFTPFATCPLPPEKNHIPIAIEAGEKMLKLY